MAKILVASLSADILGKNTCMSFALMDSWLVTLIRCSLGGLSYKNETSVDGALTGELSEAWVLLIASGTMIVLLMVTVAITEGCDDCL